MIDWGTGMEAKLPSLVLFWRPLIHDLTIRSVFTLCHVTLDFGFCCTKSSWYVSQNYRTKWWFLPHSKPSWFARDLWSNKWKHTKRNLWVYTKPCSYIGQGSIHFKPVQRTKNIQWLTPNSSALPSLNIFVLISFKLMHGTVLDLFDLSSKLLFIITFCTVALVQKGNPSLSILLYAWTQKGLTSHKFINGRVELIGVCLIALEIKNTWVHKSQTDKKCSPAECLYAIFPWTPNLFYISSVITYWHFLWFL